MVGELKDSLEGRTADKKRRRGRKEGQVGRRGRKVGQVGRRGRKEGSWMVGCQCMPANLASLPLAWCCVVSCREEGKVATMFTEIDNDAHYEQLKELWAVQRVRWICCTGAHS